MTSSRHEPRAPALAVAALAASGIVLGRLLDTGTEVPLFLLAGLGLLTLVALHPGRPGFRRFLLPLVPCVCVALGLARYAVATSAGDVLPRFNAREMLTVVGQVADPAAGDTGRTRVVVNASCWFSDSVGGVLRHTILVTIRHTADHPADLRLEEGMTLLLRGTLRRPPLEHNPGEFSPRAYHEAHGISLLMSVRNPGDVSVLDSAGGGWLMRKVVMPLRRAILRAIESTIGGEEGEFLKGILIGERGGMSASLQDAFARSGTAHVLAVSGSNVAVVTAMLMLVVQVFRGRILRALLVGAGVLCYVFLTGAQPPVVRAAVMAWVFLLGGLAGERGHPLNALGVAALVLLGVDPLQLFDLGFQLSFAAVLALVLLLPVCAPLSDRIPARVPAAGVLRGAIVLCAMSAVATMGTLPLTAMSFGRIPVIGLLANLLVVPAVGLSVVLGTVTLLASGISDFVASGYAVITTLVLHLTLLIVRSTGELPWAVIETTGFRWIDALPFYAALFLPALRWSGLPARVARFTVLAGLNAALFLPAGVPGTPGAGRLRVTFLDVGQGDAAVIQFPDGTSALIDAGPGSPEYDAGARVVLPFLTRQGIDALDFLLLTHPHDDHVGGAAAILRSVPVGRVFDTGIGVDSPLWRELRTTSPRGNTVWRTPGRGTRVDADTSVRLYLLEPGTVAEGEWSGQEYLNNASMVVRLVYGDIAFLFAGDAEEEVEAELVRRYGDFLRSDVLKVGHHGSLTSTSAPFLAAVRPEFAVISVGSTNRFHHPSPEVVERLGRSGVVALRTDEAGAVIFETDGHSLTRVGWR